LPGSATGGFFSVTAVGLDGSDFGGFFSTGWLVFVSFTRQKLFDVLPEFLVGHRGRLGGQFARRRGLFLRERPGSAGGIEAPPDAGILGRSRFQRTRGLGRQSAVSTGVVSALTRALSTIPALPRRFAS
jgi:hypothetical protein